MSQPEHCGTTPTATPPTDLRLCALAVSVLDDIDLTPTDHGVLLGGRRPVLVTWARVAEAVGAHPATSAVARRRLSLSLQLHRRVAEAGSDAGLQLRKAARVLALPSDHCAHPGGSWVLGTGVDAGVDRGVGVAGLTADPDEVVPLPAPVAEAAGVRSALWWPDLVEHAEGMAALAVQRLRRDHGLVAGASSAPRDRADRTSACGRDGSGHRAGFAASQPVVRPVGGVDALSLLTTRTLRTYLATEDGTGMRAVAVPMRSRAWYDLAHIDPAYVAAAWSATDEWDRGLSRPVLVTADDLVLPRPGGRVIAQSL